jgi:excisionase family DNA binding protein
MLLTTKEAADALKISERTLRSSRSSGVLMGVTTPPFVKFGTAVRYKESELSQWIESLESRTNV